MDIYLEIVREKFVSVTIIAIIVSAVIEAQVPNTAWYTSDPNATTFYISTADELAGLAQLARSNSFSEKTIVLLNDVNLSAYGKGSSFNGGKGWIPIGNEFNSFCGYFDGNGKTVRGLYINDAELDYAGLFGRVGRTAYVGYATSIKNLGIVDAEMTGRLSVGGLAGILLSPQSYGVIIFEDCYVTGKINGLSEVGGVVGNKENFTNIRRSYFIGSVNGSDNVGGIAGRVKGNSDNGIYQSYSIATVSGTNHVGGIVGYNEATLSNCYSSGAVIGYDFVGGIVGRGGVGNSYTIAEVSGNDFVGGVVGSGSASNCAALNPAVEAVAYNSYDPLVGRVAGFFTDDAPYDNIAFRFIDFIDYDNVPIGAATKNGADITLEEILADGTLGGWFTSDNGWTVENGKLPGLFGGALDIPEHLYSTEIVAVAENEREAIIIDDKTETSLVSPTIVLTTAFTVGPNPVNMSSGVVNFYYQGSPIKTGSLTIYDASGNVVRKISITGSTAVWDLKDSKGRNVVAGTYLARGAIKTVDGKQERVSVVVGVR